MTRRRLAPGGGSGLRLASNRLPKVSNNMAAVAGATTAGPPTMRANSGKVTRLANPHGAESPSSQPTARKASSQGKPQEKMTNNTPRKQPSPRPPVKRK